MKYCSTVHVTIIRDLDCDDCQVVSVEMGPRTVLYSVRVCVCRCCCCVGVVVVVDRF